MEPSVWPCELVGDSLDPFVDIPELVTFRRVDFWTEDFPSRLEPLAPPGAPLLLPLGAFLRFCSGGAMFGSPFKLMLVTVGEASAELPEPFAWPDCIWTCG